MSATTASESPQPAATGTPTTNSSGKPMKTPSGKLQSGILKIQALGDLVGWESIRRTLSHQDSLSHRELLAHQKAIHGDRVGDVPAAADSEMGHIILGDVTITEQQKQGQQQKPGMSTFAKLAAAALAATGVGLPVGVGLALPTIIDALTTKPPVTQPADPATIERDWKLGDPILE